ncbi:hypothetical protein TVAG_161670 [Trichomonas vaginalis G3]|uniref:Uncharacterized protein n=1 Tax=Trichomonas vaginalis (strain ATCC PRA-98 / G3) TaxID=412133 RepID=A2EUP0_TRIV3|nr:armadillo (ARM) repeat-containing protein family [Trichomonas vaginalis G3]EAY03628.1 hypothetical protein TVAG_161670 [Trichomonas vaginalis G3]KAI5524723.1 armadillo (ARM) repeat-containing protein family [Trichomonas vaginalis G3]|eukprot:XP_001315851.1 hypothetical protein [Trichomonas vaginalis G3]
MISSKETTGANSIQIKSKNSIDFTKGDSIEGESFDDVQIRINQLHSQDLSEKFLAVQYFAEFLEDQYLPPPMMPDFRNVILSLFFNTEQLPEHHMENLLIILQKIVEFFEPEFEFLDLFNRTWSLLPNSEAFNLLAQIIKISPQISLSFLQNQEFCNNLQQFMLSEEEEIRNSALIILYSLSSIQDNISMISPFFKILIQNLMNPEETEDNSRVSIGVLTNMAQTDSGLVMIEEEQEFPFALRGCLRFNNLHLPVLKFLHEVASSSSKPLKIFEKFEIFDFIISSLDSKKPKLIQCALNIFISIAESGEDAVTTLNEFQLIQKIVPMQRTLNVKIDQLIIEILCCFCYNGNSEIINFLFDSDIIQEFISYLDLNSRSLRISILRALQAMTADFALQGNRSALEDIASNDELMDKIWGFTEEFEGCEEGVIANHIYNSLNGEE